MTFKTKMWMLPIIAVLIVVAGIAINARLTASTSANLGWDLSGSIWTLAGTPCVTLPAGTGANGLPLGIQLVGLRHEDDRLLSTAAWVAARL